MTSGPPDAPAVRVFLGLSLAVALLALVIHTAGVGGALEPDLSIPAWEPTDAEATALDATWAARLSLAQGLKGEDIDGLMTSYESYNQADGQRSPGARPGSGLADAWAAYEQWALQVEGRLGVEGYMALGAQLAEELEGAIRSGDKTGIQRLGGAFAAHLAATGLAWRGPRAPGEAARSQVRKIAALERWARALVQRSPIDRLMHSAERELLTRWKLAANPLVPGPRRVELSRQLEAMGTTYPVVEAMAARAAADRDWRAAAALYGLALERRPGDRQLEANAAFATTKINEGVPTPEGEMR